MGGGSAPCCTGEMGWQTRVELATPGVTAQARTVWVLPPWSARQDTILRPPRCGRGALPLSYRRLVPTPGLEPGHSGVKARYPSSRVRSAWSSSRESNPVSPAYQAGAFTIWPDEDWWTRQVPTLRPPACRSGALPLSYGSDVVGGQGRGRTDYLPVFTRALSQASYLTPAPLCGIGRCCRRLVAVAVDVVMVVAVPRAVAADVAGRHLPAVRARLSRSVHGSRFSSLSRY